MVNLSNILLVAFCAAVISADSSCGNGQQQIISGAKPDQVTVCCPGVMKAKSNNGYCCIGGTNDDCGKTTCFDDTSSCKALINVHDSNYVKEIEDAASVKPRRPGHPNDSDTTDSKSNSTSGASSSADATAAITINTTATSTASPNSASPESPPATASNSQGPSSAVSNSVAATDTGAAGNNRPIMGLVAGLAAVPAIMYGL